MTKPSNFIQNSDYASLKNDATGSFTLYLNGSTALNYGDKYIYESFLDIGTQGANMRCQIQSDAVTGIFSSPQMQITLQATISGGGGVIDYFTTAYVERITPTRIRLACNVYGIAVGLTTTITGKFQTVTADVATFLSPFI